MVVTSSAAVEVGEAVVVGGAVVIMNSFFVNYVTAANPGMN